MRPKIFVSTSPEGWKEVKIPEKYRQYSYEALIKVAHRFIDISAYKGLLVTENPNPFEEQKQKSERLSA